MGTADSSNICEDTVVGRGILRVYTFYTKREEWKGAARGTEGESIQWYIVVMTFHSLLA